MNEKSKKNWLSLSDWLKSRHNERVQKIPLDLNFSCPNRDGKLSNEGCIFCSTEGSGSGLGQLSIQEQWEYWRQHFIKKRHNNKFIAYLQAYTNTYAPIENLARLYAEICTLPDIVGLSIGTRPDCFNSDIAKLIAEQKLPVVRSSKYTKEIWVEFGVQSAHNKSLEILNRQHNIESAEQAILLAREQNILVCVHLMAGIPNESFDDFMQTIDWVNKQNVQGVKLHCLYIPRNTKLAEMFNNSLYVALEQEEYIKWAGEAIKCLNKDIVIHRVTGDPILGTKEKREAINDLIAPSWAVRKSETVRFIEKYLE